MILRMLILAGAVSAWSFFTPAIAQDSQPNSDKTTKAIPFDPSKCQPRGDKTFCPSFALTEPQFEAYQKKIGGTLKLELPTVEKGIYPGEPCLPPCYIVGGICTCRYVIQPSVLGSAEFEAMKEVAKIK